MSIESTTAPKSQSTKTRWATWAPRVAPPLAASLAIIPVFYGFIVKNAQQLGKQIPRMGAKDLLKEGCIAAPIIGTQVVMQMCTEGAIKHCTEGSGDEKKETANFARMFLSSILVGAVSAPALAVFNGLASAKLTGQAPLEAAADSLKSLRADPKQPCALVARETSFLFALRISAPVTEQMKRTFGENKVVEYGSSFATGAIGSLVGHPADTAFTLWQNGMKVEKLTHLMRGAPVKAVTVGLFSIGYKTAKEAIERNLS